MIILERCIRFKSKSIDDFLSRCIYLPDDIRELYRDGDEIWHYNDFGFAPRMCEREMVFLIREGKIIKGHIVKMS